jgi:hypothetical protein
MVRAAREREPDEPPVLFDVQRVRRHTGNELYPGEDIVEDPDANTEATTDPVPTSQR